jgi:hypothetical protein
VAPIAGAELIKECQKTSNTMLLAFSCGKDAIGAWLFLREHGIKVIPYYMWLVPGLSFVEEALAYYEDFFGTRICRAPHPSIFRMLNNLVFQPPEREAIIQKFELPNPDYDDVANIIKDELGLDRKIWVADGVRTADSPNRRTAILKFGSLNYKRRAAHVIWDWNKDRLIGEIQAANVQLPIDYAVWGRSFDGIDRRFLSPLKKHFPADYAKVLEWFPLADAELARFEFQQRHQQGASHANAT